MNSVELIRALSARGVQLTLGRDEMLSYAAPQGVITPEILSAIRNNKRDIIEILRSADLCPASRIRRVEPKQYYELSSAQTRLWVLSHFTGASVAYNVAGVYEISGALNQRQLQAAFKQLIGRHQILRTRFVVVEGVPKQVVEDVEKVSCQIGELVSGSSDRTIEMIAQETNRPFDLARAPLIRMTLIRAGAEQHFLVSVLHHIICDGISIAILTRDLLELHRAIVEQRAPSLPPLQIQYPDFAEWQNNVINNGELAHELAYWRERLSKGIEPLNLYTDKKRPAARLYRGRSITQPVPDDVARALTQFAASQGTTAFTVFITAVKCLLHCYTRQEEIAVGVPASERSVAELKDQIGLFTNTLVIVDTVRAGQSFVQFLGDVKRTLFGAYAHQFWPFDKLVEVLNPPRDTSRNPLFDVMVGMNEAPTQDGPSGLGIKPVPLETSTCKFDLNIQLTREARALTLSIEFDSDLFHAETIRRMAGQLVELLRSALAEPNTKIGELNLLSETEIRQFSRAAPSNARAFPKRDSIAQQFELCVARGENRRAASMGLAGPAADAQRQRGLTRGQLNRAANQLANLLRNEFAAGPNLTVPLLLERGMDMLIAVLGVLKSGAAYAPIDPSVPAERTACILEDLSADYVLTERRHRHLVPEGVTALCLDESRFYTGDASNPPQLNKEDDLCYVIYTSGSSGTPKGVMVPHRGVLNTLFAMEDRYPVSSRDVYLFKTSYTFDVSATELFSWCFGDGEVVLLERGGEFDPDTMAAAIRKSRVTHINFVPSMLKAFLAGWDLKAGDLASLKHILVAGEAFDLKLFDLVKKSGLADRVSNIYGPTEASIYATAFDLDTDPVPAESGSVPIGKPITNTGAVVVAPGGFGACPSPVPGELCLSGAGLGRGYSNPEETAKAFVTHPESGERLYRTGDLVRWNPAGDLEFLGRIDQQVKVRGFRVELAEIESVLLKHSQVRDAAVVFRSEEAASRLCAFVVGDDGLTATDLREFVRQHLPGYMVPSEFLKVDALPRNQSGKTDKRSLLNLKSTFKADRPAVRPGSTRESAILAVWEALLGRDGIGVSDSFFDVGGTSLLLIELRGRLCAGFGVEFGVTELFQNPTIAAQAKLLNSFEPANGGSPTPDPASKVRKRTRYQVQKKKLRRSLVR